MAAAFVEAVVSGYFAQRQDDIDREAIEGRGKYRLFFVENFWLALGTSKIERIKEENLKLKYFNFFDSSLIRVNLLGPYSISFSNSSKSTP